MQHLMNQGLNEPIVPVRNPTTREDLENQIVNQIQETTQDQIKKEEYHAAHNRFRGIGGVLTGSVCYYVAFKTTSNPLISITAYALGSLPFADGITSVITGKPFALLSKFYKKDKSE